MIQSAYHHPVKPQGRSNDGAESGMPTDASCYLYFEGDSVVSGPRSADALTVQAEAMTQAEFADFQRDRVDQTTSVFIAQIRHAIITQNEQGEFVENRISPSVLTDDWVLRATHFVKTIVENKQDKTNLTNIELQMVDKRKGAFSEGWLNAKVHTTKPYSLPLVMFTKKEEDAHLQACLDKIMAAVHKVLKDLFPDCTVAPLRTTRALWGPQNNQKKYKPIGNGDDKLSKALERFKARKAQEAGSKADMERRGSKRQKKEAATQKEATLQEALLVVPGDWVQKDSDCKKYSKKSLWDSVAVYRQAPQYWGAHQGDGVTWWVWKGLLASLAVYYIYSRMRY